MFISTFKWEARKGWDVLLSAYLAEFTAADNVELYILTKPFMDGGNFKERMRQWANTTFHGRWVGGRGCGRSGATAAVCATAQLAVAAVGPAWGLGMPCMWSIASMACSSWMACWTAIMVDLL